MNILSIRGGGIRGLAVAQMLASLDVKFKGGLVSYFDLIVGTSTGAILAVALGLGLTPLQIVDFYLKDGPVIFKRRWAHRFGLTGSKYSHDVLLEKLSQRYGGRLLQECKKRTMATATNLSTLRAKFFKSWQRDGNPWLTAAGAACASASAPTYFDPMVINDQAYADGGLFANDPALYALAEGFDLNAREQHDFAGLKIVDVACPRQLMKPAVEKGAIEFAGRALDVILESGMDAVEEACKRFIGEANYLKIQPSLQDASPALDDVSARNLDALVKAGADAAGIYEKRLRALLNPMPDAINDPINGYPFCGRK